MPGNARGQSTGQTTAGKRIWGWFFFDWASQPYNTLIITFVFGPYVASLIGDGSRAQTVWGLGVAAAGAVTALSAPILGAVADQTGRRMPWISAFSVMYVVGAATLWFTSPQDFDVLRTMLFFGIGLIGMELATIFTNAMLPDLASRERLGRLSGTGWAFGYLGGLISLLIMLLFLAEDGTTGTTLLGFQPLFGLVDPDLREGTRLVGPFSALWYIVFMIPFFVWVKEPRPERRASWREVRSALASLGTSVRSLPRRRSLFAYLGASMLYRDGLTGAYSIGAIFAAGVLDWTVVQTGTFGILAVISGALFAWLGGRADQRFGPKPVIVVSILALIAAICACLAVTRESVLGVPQSVTSQLPDMIFMGIGCVIGAAGGALQAASRTMLIHQADPARMTESFGLYALSGKATAFLAPLSVGLATAATGSQHWGITPLIVLFAAGLILLAWVDPEGETAR